MFSVVTGAAEHTLNISYVPTIPVEIDLHSASLNRSGLGVNRVPWATAAFDDHGLVSP